MMRQLSCDFPIKSRKEHHFLLKVGGSFAKRCGAGDSFVCLFFWQTAKGSQTTFITVRKLNIMCLFMSLYMNGAFMRYFIATQTVFNGILGLVVRETDTKLGILSNWWGWRTQCRKPWMTGDPSAECFWRNSRLSLLAIPLLPSLWPWIVECWPLYVHLSSCVTPEMTLRCTFRGFLSNTYSHMTKWNLCVWD